MPNGLLSLLCYVVGFLLAVATILWAIILSSQNQLSQNAFLLLILGVIAAILLIMGRQTSEDHR